MEHMLISSVFFTPEQSEEENTESFETADSSLKSEEDSDDEVKDKSTGPRGIKYEFIFRCQVVCSDLG
jgi:hypothetical protein